MGLESHFTRIIWVPSGQLAAILPGWCRQTVAVGVENEFEAIGNTELRENGSEVIAYSNFGNKQPFGNLLSFEPLCDENDDIRRFGFSNCKSFGAVCGFSDNRHSLMVLDKHAQPGADHQVILDDADADRLSGLSFRGDDALSRNGVHLGLQLKWNFNQNRRIAIFRRNIGPSSQSFGAISNGSRAKVAL